VLLGEVDGRRVRMDHVGWESSAKGSCCGLGDGGGGGVEEEIWRVRSRESGRRRRARRDRGRRGLVMLVRPGLLLGRG
jgi:hypothetical protein